MLKFSYLYRYLFPLVLLWASLSTLRAQEQSDSLWIKDYNYNLHYDYKGNLDTLRSMAWKAFYLAKDHHDITRQLSAMSKFMNTHSVDSLSRYLAIVDTFPESVYKARVFGDLEMTYYTSLFADFNEEKSHALLERIVNKADSLYADSLFDKNNRDAEIMYLLKNRCYLDILVYHVHVTSKESPFYHYIQRLNSIVDRLPAEYCSSKLNTFITTSKLALDMGEYEECIDLSERVVQGLKQSPKTPDNIEEMKMSQASVCYLMYYQQLQCYDHITDSIVERNWAFMKTPYGERCLNYLYSFESQDEISALLYYYMCKKRYDLVIAGTEEKIQQYADDIAFRQHYVNLQTEALICSNRAYLHIDKLERNYAYNEAYQQLIRKKDEVDYTNLFEINKLRHSIAFQQLEQKEADVRWSHVQFRGLVLIVLLSFGGIVSLVISSVRKKDLIKRLRSITAQNIEEKEKTERAKTIQTVCLNNMNHEIRSPLNGLVGFAELLLEDPHLDLETKKEFTEQIETSSDMLLQIINDVLDTAQLESGQYKFDNAYWSVHSLCEYAIKSMEHRLQPGVVMCLNCEISSDVKIFTDKTRLLQILLNFLSNACKHTSEGRVTFDCNWKDENEKDIVFTVTDTGDGVPIDKQPHLFERFAKLNHKVQGTGLGLNICATLAHAMNAEVGYDSEYTNGARFYLVMPKG